MRLLQPCKNVHIARVLPIFHHSILPVQRFSLKKVNAMENARKKWDQIIWGWVYLEIQIEIILQGKTLIDWWYAVQKIWGKFKVNITLKFLLTTCPYCKNGMFS